MFDDEKLDIPCPECDRVVKMSIGEIKRKPSYVCPGCRSVVNLDARKLLKGLKDAEKQVDDFVDEIDQIFK